MRDPKEQERIERMAATPYPERIRLLAQQARTLVEDYQGQMELEPPGSARHRAYRLAEQALEGLDDAASSFEGNTGAIPAKAVLCRDCRFWSQKGMENENAGQCLVGGSLRGNPDHANTSAYAADSEEYAASLVTLPHHGCVQGQPKETPAEAG